MRLMYWMSVGVTATLVYFGVAKNVPLCFFFAVWTAGNALHAGFKAGES